MLKLTEFGIENFRGIKQGHLRDLSTINILVGRNNSGKSTILDAIQFISRVTKAKDPLDRDVLDHMQRRKVNRGGVSVHAMFYGYNVDTPIRFDLTFNDKTIITLYCDKDQTWQLHNDSISDFIVKSQKTASGFDLYRKSEKNVPITANNWTDFLSKWYESMRQDPVNKIGQLMNYMSDSILIESGLVNQFRLIEDKLWDRLLARRKDKILRDILKDAYSPDIESFSLSVPEGMNESVLNVLLPDRKVRIDDLGDGIKFACSLLAIALQDEIKILLLEEPENSQHPLALQKIAKVLVDLALRKDQEKQIFVATHSLDLINAFVDAMQEKIGDKMREELKIYLLSLHNGKLDAKSVDAYDAGMLKELGIDLRRFVELYTYLIVEGSEDRTFLEAICRKLKGSNLLDLKYEVYDSPKNEQNKVIKALATFGRRMKVIRDLDNQTVQQLIDSVHDSLPNKWNIPKNDNGTISIPETGSMITVIPSGLPNDGSIKSFTAKFMMEDYLVKIAEKDTNIQQWIGMPFAELVKASKKHIRSGEVHTSKNVLAEIKTVKEIEDDSALITTIIEKASKDTVEEVSRDLCNDLFGRS